MIIQFTVENFLSFKEPATLSLAASALKEKQTRSDEIVFELEGTNLSLLKSAVIYGANASGKSNLVKALDFFKWFVINSSKGVQSGESIRVESFRLNRRTEQEPSYFEAVFADETVQYRYGFEVDEKRVHREWLYQKGNKRKAKEVELFLRDGDEYELHPKFSVGKEVVSQKNGARQWRCFFPWQHSSTKASRWKSWDGWPTPRLFLAAATSGFGKWR